MAVLWSGRNVRKVLSALVGKYHHHVYSHNTEKDEEAYHIRLVSLDAKWCGPTFNTDNKTLFVHGLKVIVPSASLFKVFIFLY